MKRTDVAYLGIDPGLHGAIAGLDINGELVLLMDMPVESITVTRKVRAKKDELGDPLPIVGPKTKPGKKAVYVVNELRDIIQDNAHAYLVFEKQHAMPGQGVTSMFTTGYGYGLLTAFSSAFCVPTAIVSPEEWTKLLLKGVAGEGKERALSVARSMYPSAERLNKTNGRADALMLATFAYLKFGRTRSAT